MTSVAVTSRSFSQHPILRNELSKRYQHVVFNETGKTLRGNDLINFLENHSFAIIGLEQLDAVALTKLPNLKVISRFGVGLDNIDLAAIKQRGIRLAYTAGANKRSVSELVIAFAINMLRQLPFANQQLRDGVWQQRKGQQLSEKSVGIIGLGAVGKDLAVLLKQFHCKLFAFDLVDQTEFCLSNNLLQVDLDTLLQQADIVTLHLPFNKTTQYILDAHRLSLLKPNTILINTARGGLVDEQAIKVMLKNKKLAAAAFDVFATEPPCDQELLSLPNFFATPHIGGSTEEAILAMGHAAIEGLESAVLI